MNMGRRQFLATTGTAVLAAGSLVRGEVFGANERIRVGCIGLNGRGWALARTAQAREDTEVVALCDVDSNVLSLRAKELKEKTGKDPRTYTDMRDLIADKGIDVVTIGTPNHWHTLAAIWALQAGKDVYVEKPISHTLWEGRQLVAAAKKYGKVVQHGTQRRSVPHWQRAAERLHSGLIGDIYMARCSVNRMREAFSYPMAETPPDYLDWTLWQGPATEKPYSRNYVHYKWHWFWHYGNGEIGNNGPHRADLANWMLNKGLPVQTYSTGGIFGYEKDARETPNTQVVTHTYADGTIMVFDVRNRFTERGPSVAFYGTDGYMADGQFFGKDGKEIPDDQTPEEVNLDITHMASFIEAVKKKDPAAVSSTPEQGHIAAALCHLGNISYRLKRGLTFDPKTETFPGDEEANKLLTRVYRKGFEVPALATPPFA